MLDDIKFEMSMDPTHCKDGNLAFLEWKIINEIWPLFVRGPNRKWERLNMVPNKEFDIDFKFVNTGDISAKIKMNGKFTLSKLAELSSLIPELIEVSTYYLLDYNVASTLYIMAIPVMDFQIRGYKIRKTFAKKSTFLILYPSLETP